MKTKTLFSLFFAALTLFYLSLSPTSIFGQGYTAENAAAADQIISNFDDWLAFRHAQVPVVWPRHGLLELLFEIPFLLVAKLSFGTPLWADRMLSLQPVLVTASLCTLIFVWVRLITSSLTWGYVLATIAGLSTMLWPYAYIGLETTQSMFLLLAGYLALGSTRKRTWPHALLFGLSCALAVSLKSNGIFLVPAAAFLWLVYARGHDWKKTIAVFIVIAGLYQLNAYTRSLSPAWNVGTVDAFLAFSVGPTTAALNAWSLLFSANKGLLFFCPPLILALLALQTAYKNHAQIVIFAVLTLGGLVGGSSLLFFYTDETWGPRYLHAAVAPLFICLALTRQGKTFQFRKEIPLVALALCGASISFLGASYYYGAMHLAAIRTGHSTLEGLQHDPNWNHPRFNLMLLRTWTADSADPVLWTPSRQWWYEAPPDASPLKAIDLRDFASPQAGLVRGWSVPRTGAEKVFWYVLLLCPVLSAILFVWLGRLVLRDEADAILAAR